MKRYRRAGPQGDKDTVRMGKQCRSEMTREQLAEAQRLSVELFSRIEAAKNNRKKEKWNERRI